MAVSQQSEERKCHPREDIVAFYIAKEAAVEKGAKENSIVSLIKLLSLLCVLGFILFTLRMEQQPFFSIEWFSTPVDNQLELRNYNLEGKRKQFNASKPEGSSGTLELLPLAVWGVWGPWSACSKRKYCQEGHQHRRRACLSLEESAQCLGVSMEAQDCPAAACVHAYSTPPALADQSPAPSTSFLGQECNATIKYSASGKHKDLVPSSVYHLFPSATKMLKSGFFAVEVIPKVLEKESTITKVCFEPFGVWSLPMARKVFHLNRSTKASLKELKSNNLVGLAITLRPDGALYGVLLATGTPGGLYSNVYYRRFRGRSFHEEISF